MVYKQNLFIFILCLSVSKPLFTMQRDRIQPKHGSLVAFLNDDSTVLNVGQHEIKSRLYRLQNDTSEKAENEKKELYAILSMQNRLATALKTDLKVLLKSWQSMNNELPNTANAFAFSLSDSFCAGEEYARRELKALQQTSGLNE